MNEYSIDKYFELFFSIYNPVFLSIIFFLLLFIVVLISYRHIYQPLIVKHREEKENLELKSAKLLALFTELDPNPIIKIDPEGFIAGMNKSAKEIFKLDTSAKNKIDVIFKPVSDEPAAENTLSAELAELIKNNRSALIKAVIAGRFYEINIHGISMLNMAQLYFYDITDKKKHIEQMDVYQKLLKESSAHLTEVLEEERGRLAAMLHDSVGQNLLLIKLGLQNLKKYSNITASDPEFFNILSLLDSSIDEIKDIAKSIRPLNLDELGLNTVLTSICKNVSRESNIEAHLYLPDENIKLARDVEVCLYRVTQEALNNIIKHSKAKNFSVNLSVEDDFINLMISDDGIGFKPTVLFENKYISDGIGILTMQERVERLNGTFHIDSDINQGTIILINFPNKKLSDESRFKYKSTHS